MQSMQPVRRTFASLVRGGRRFADDQRGVTAIEFGLLGIPFFAIMAAILETALIFLASQILDSAVQDTARNIRTGRYQAANYTAEQYKAALCDGLYGLFNCTNLKIRVRVIDNFTAANLTSPVSTTGANAGEWTVTEQYTPGIGGSVVLVEAYYKWPVILNFGGFSLQNQPDGTRLLSGIRLFRNEPFG